MTSNRYLVGVDIGTTGSKGALVDLNGNVKAYHYVAHGVETPRAGWYEHDPDAVWWKDLCTITRTLIARSGVDPRDIAAFGLTALSPEMLPVDEQGRPLRKHPQRNSRASKQVAERRALRDIPVDEARKSSVRRGPAHLWSANEPATGERTARSRPASATGAQLTGRSVVN